MNMVYRNDRFRQSLFIVQLILVLVIAFVDHYIWEIPSSVQWIFFGMTVVGTGIPHGAIDHQVAKQTSNLNQDSFSVTKFYIGYIFPLIIYGVCWYFFPTISLMLFLLMSAFHFGETDIVLQEVKQSIAIVILQISYGLMILFLILFFNIQSVISILQQSNIFTPALIKFLQSPTASSYSLTASFSFFLISLLGYHFVHGVTVDFLQKLFSSFLVVAISAICLPLPISFAIYFGIWHSIISLNNIRFHLSIASGKKLSFLQVMLKCIPFTIFSLLGILVLIIVFNFKQNSELFLIGLFIGISMLTLPHQAVMSKMYAQIRKKENREIISDLV